MHSRFNHHEVLFLSLNCLQLFADAPTQKALQPKAGRKGHLRRVLPETSAPLAGVGNSISDLGSIKVVAASEEPSACRRPSVSFAELNVCAEFDIAMGLQELRRAYHQITFRRYAFDFIDANDLTVFTNSESRGNRSDQ